MIKSRKSTITFLIVLAVLFLAGCYLIAAPFLDAIFFAVVLGIVFWPVHARILRWSKRPGMAALATTLLAILLTIVPMFFFEKAIAGEISQVYSNLQDASARQGGWRPLFENTVERAAEWAGRTVGLPKERIIEEGTKVLTAAGKKLVGIVPAYLGNLASTLATAFITFLTMYFVLRDGQTIRHHAARLLPVEEHVLDRLIDAISDSIIANVYGMVAVAAAQGALAGIGYAIAGMSAPMLWGFLTGVCSVIPVVGPTIIWVPAAIAVGVTGSWGKCIFLLIWGALVIGSADNVIRPMVISGRSNLNGLVIFFALLGGVQVAGFAGIFLGPLVVSMTVTTVALLERELRDTDTGVKLVAGDPGS